MAQPEAKLDSSKINGAGEMKTLAATKFKNVTRSLPYNFQFRNKSGH